MKHIKPGRTSGAPSGKDVAAPLGVNLFLDVARKLDDEAEWALTSNPTGAAEVAGLLLGNAGRIIEISDCEPVLLMQKLDHAYALTGPGSLEFKRMMAAFSAPESERRAVGFYRSQIGERVEPEEEDIRLTRACFGDAPHVVLLMNRGVSGSRRARLFLEDQSNGLCELCREADAPREIGPSNHEAEHVPKELARADTSIPETRKVEEISPTFQWRSFRVASLWAVQALAACLLGYMILTGSRGPKNSQFSASAGHDTASSGSSQPGLALRAEWQGENLRLSWDRKAPALSEAKGGELIIREGNEPGREVLLDGDLLRTGSVIYRPSERHVSFRLAVFGQGSDNIPDSVATAP